MLDAHSPNDAERLYRPLDADIIACPFPTYEELRQTGPVIWHSGLASWLVTSFEAYCKVVDAPDVFVADWRKVGVPTPDAALSIQTLDPPEQSELQAVVLNAFRAVDLDAVADHVRASLRGRLSEFASRGEVFNFIDAVASPVALDATCSFLGVTVPDYASVAPLADAIVTSMDHALIDDDEIRLGMQARAALSELVVSWFESTADDGLIGRLRDAPTSAAVSGPVLMNTVRAVFQGGFQSWGRFMGIATLNLLTRGQLRHAAQPDTCGPAVEELLRFESSVQADARAALVPTQLAGVAIGAGDTVVLLHGAVDRDPARFPDPDDLVLNRRPNPHSAFGRGVHACPGALFVRRLTKLLLTELAQYDPPLAMAGEPVWKRNATSRGLSILPVTFGARNHVVEPCE